MENKQITPTSSFDEIPETAFYYGEEPEQTVDEKPEPAKRELNWSLLLACFFGMSTMALLIYVVGL
ncbi:hypothetical protein [Pseudomonas putida]|uniref:hypothetical protein n=1 Tax=Pseudomonas putida TaxID=303 RepID=UPI0013AF06B9|nr:hypothetical protein [Pseudomonas putida]